MTVNGIRPASIPFQPTRQPVQRTTGAEEPVRIQEQPAGGRSTIIPRGAGTSPVEPERQALEVLTADEKEYLEQLFPGSSEPSAITQAYTSTGKKNVHAAGTIIDRKG